MHNFFCDIFFIYGTWIQVQLAYAESADFSNLFSSLCYLHTKHTLLNY